VVRAEYPELTMTSAPRKISADFPHLALATGIGGWAAWYCWDAWKSSPDVENLILIVPVAAIAILLYLFVAITCFRGAAREAEHRKPLATGVGFKIAGSMALLAGLVVGGPLIGFDVASFLYMLGMLAFLGERRWYILLLVPLLFCGAAIYCFNSLLATPLPLYFGNNS
jgi:hypothetical protein